MTKAGLADLTIPISSFQVFKRRDGTLGLQVTTRRFDLANAIADRARGYIVVTATINGALEEVGTAKVTRIRLDEGPMNKSITIQATARNNMGKGEIISGGDSGLYQVRLKYYRATLDEKLDHARFENHRAGRKDRRIAHSGRN